MLRLIFGKPGMGKTLIEANEARKVFKRDNPPFKVWFTEKILRKKWVYTNRIYSDFPLILKDKKKNKIYQYFDENGEIKESDIIGSFKVSIFDLILENKFIDGAQIFVDEIQMKYDSMEYRDFPDAIAHFCQAHRHFDYDIFINSQSQSRVIKRLLVLAEEYWEIRNFRRILGFGICDIRVTWDMTANLENGHFNEDNLDVDYCRRIFKLKKSGTIYDSKYLRSLQDDSKIYHADMYNSKLMDKETLLNGFFPTKAERERISNMRY